MSDPRARARELAREAVDAGRPVEWFERLYQEASTGAAIVPWDDRRANPHLCRWLDANAGALGGGRALDVGCGTGDNAAELARRGLSVVAFDVAPSAVAEARRRFGASSAISFEVADVLALPAAWRAAFDLVTEIYTLQVLPAELRATALRSLGDCVADGGTLVVVARGREPSDPEGSMPWPLTRDELEAGATASLELVGFDDYLDDECPPVRRFVATYRRARPNERSLAHSIEARVGKPPSIG